MLLAVNPRYRTTTLSVPVIGAWKKVNTLPPTAYEAGFCITPETLTNRDDGAAGATVKLNEVVLPLPEKVSTKKACVDG